MKKNMGERIVRREDMAVDEQLRILYALQKVDSQIDAIRALRGELPLEVQDLEDEIAGLQTRIVNLESDVKRRLDEISGRKLEIKEADALIKKYTEQQQNVRNNREYEALAKELEYQKLEIELCNKKIKERKASNELLNEQVEATRQKIAERELDLVAKRAELESIVAETAKEEEELLVQSAELLAALPERLQKGYSRIRSNARNGLAVVTIVRNSCGGCFNRVPPQRQLDIRMRKKLIVCEYCGRLIVDSGEETIQED